LDQIRVFGLTRLDTLDLKREYPEAGITFEPTERADTEHGELVTAALIGVSFIGLQALAAWLMKDRESDTIEKTLEIINPDGSRRVEKFSYRMSKSTSQADVVKALANMTKLDVTKLLASS
jgi:hypothetical protein